MKLSIWQQFSSNHSNSFTIIGQFKEELDAIDGAKRLEIILNTMLANSKQENAQEILKAQMEKLGLVWHHKNIPDWLKYGPPTIERYENTLLISHDNNWSLPQPLDLLLDKLGSKSTALSSEIEDNEILWTWDFDIVDVSQADALETLVVDVLTMDIKDYDEKYADFPTNMMWLIWREEIGDSPVVFTRNQAQFRIVNARFYDGTTLYDAVSNFRVWLEESGASNIRYSVRNEGS
jgi:hypothetical protein